MRAATVVQQLCKSCRTCFMFYCVFYFTRDRSLTPSLLDEQSMERIRHAEHQSNLLLISRQQPLLQSSQSGTIGFTHPVITTPWVHCTQPNLLLLLSSVTGHFGHKTLQHQIYEKSGHFGPRTIPTRHSSTGDSA